MRFDRNEKYVTICAYILVCSIILTVFGLLCFNFSSFLDLVETVFSVLKPIIYALAIAFILYPLENFIFDKLLPFTEKNKKRPVLRKALSLVLTYVLVLALISSFVGIILPQVITSYNDLSVKAPEYILVAQRFIEKHLDASKYFDFVVNVPIETEEFVPGVTEVLPFDILNKPMVSVDDMNDNALFATYKRIQSEGVTVDIVEMLKRLLSNSFDLMEKIIPYIWGFLANLFTEVKNLLLGLVISIYFLASKKRLKAQIKKTSKAFLSQNAFDKARHVVNITVKTFTEFIDGKILDAIVIGILCFIFMTILKLPYAPLISVLVGFTNMIPFLGPFLGAVPGALIIFIISPVKTIWFILLIIGLQQLDMNLIEPKIVGDKTGLPSVFVISGVLIFGGMLGVLGLFVGVPIFAVLYTLIKEWSNKKLEKKGMPTETEYYCNIDN